jgi:uncharacterized protein YdaU (DUF1376 family)
MQFYVAEYLADTMHLSTEEHGAYLLLIFNYWQTGKPIPKNRLSRIAKIPNDRWTTVEDSLKEFFNDTGTEWVHKRIEADLAVVAEAHKQKAAAGKASAESRKRAKQAEEKQKANGRSTPVATPVDVPLPVCYNETATNRTEQNRTEQIIKNTMSETPSVSDRFEIFWEFARGEYKKLEHPPGAKAEALEAFKKLKPDDALCKRMCEALRTQVAAKLERARLGHDSAQLKHVCRWISKSCYDDDPDPVPAGQAAIGRGGLAPAQRSLHSFENVDYSKGVNPDGSF